MPTDLEWLMQPRQRMVHERGLRQAVLAGDENAWRLWYEESFGALHAYVSWRCAGLRDLADEIVQETWLTAIRNMRRFDPEQGSFLGWLRGIAAHQLRNELRRRARRGAMQPLSEHAAETSDDRNESAWHIANALNALPERYETLLRAKYLEGRSLADISAETGESAKALESALTRARHAFREAYQAGTGQVEQEKADESRA